MADGAVMDDQATQRRTEVVVEAFNPFARSAEGERHAGAGAVQTRASTEILAMVMSAKQYPRDVVRAARNIQNAFTRPTLAEQSQYAFARGGSTITGPSIRAAEAISQQWGNMSNGWRELNRYVGPDGVGVSECEAFSIDYESNSRESIQFVVRHWRDTKQGGYKLREERDIYELCANQSQRRKRACILAQVPGDLVEMAMEQASVTLNAKADTSAEGIQKLEETFKEFGVTREHLQKFLQRSLDAILPAQVVALKRIYASMRDGVSGPSDWFDIAAEDVKSDRLEAVREAAKQRRGGKEQKGAGGAAPAPAAAAQPGSPQPQAATARAARASDGARSGNAAQADLVGGEAGNQVDDRQYARLADQINKAADAEIAALVLDEARGMLTGDAYDDLIQVWKNKWEPKR